MATANVNQQCSICNEENDTYDCKGCKKSFCLSHLTEHYEKIQQEFHHIEHNYNLFQQNIIEQKNDPNQHSLINKINEWEKDSIKNIQQIADECRQRLIKYLNKYIIIIENRLKDLFEQLKKLSKENKFNEINLEQFKYKLNKLQEEFNKPTNISVQQEKSLFINKNFATVSIDKDTKWKQNAITIAGGNKQGNQLNQLNRPYGIYIDDDQTIYIADCYNHRIMEWKSYATNGRIVAGGNGQGNQMNQLSYPKDVIIDKKNNSLIISDYGNRRIMEWSLENNTNTGQVIILNILCYGLTIDKNGDIYVCDEQKHEVKRWKRGEKEGTLVAGGNGKGNLLNQFDEPTYIFVDDDLSLYVSDTENHRIMKWVKDAKEGIVVEGGNGQRYSLTQLYLPAVLTVDQLGQIYVADHYNDRVMRWCEGDKKGSIVVGGNDVTNQLSRPIGLSFDQQGNLYVSDFRKHRIQKFEID